MKYKVGDKVRIKSLDWYNENKDSGGIVVLSTHVFIPEMSEYCGTIVTIKDAFEDIDDNVMYYIEENDFDWTDEMIEGLVEEETKPEPKFKVGDKIKLKSTLLNDVFGIIGYEPEGYRITNISNGLMYFMSYSIEHYYELVEDEPSIDLTVKGEEVKERIEIAIPEGYEYVIESGKIIFTKKKPKYPKSYEECLKILNTDDDDCICISVPLHYNHLLISFTQLLICRDAYWKIAGEEMGLGKPWEPEYKKERYVIHRYIDEIVKGYRQIGLMEHFILEFPTGEMRDAFFENFEELINDCKELL